GRGRTHSVQTTTAIQQTARGGGLPLQRVTIFRFQDQAFGHDDVVPMDDLEIGLEWGRMVGQARLFLRAGIVSQTWFNAGTATSENGDLGFFGLNVTTGFLY